MNKTAVKSMLSLAFYLLILIAVWAVIGVIAFPNADNQDVYGKLVPENRPLLAQIAENAIDSEKWPGIMQTAEAQALIKELGVSDIQSAGFTVAFTIPRSTPDEYLYIEYVPDDIAYPNAEAALAGMGYDPADWLRVDAPEGTERWEGGPFGKGYYNFRKLCDGFWLVNCYLPT